MSNVSVLLIPIVMCLCFGAAVAAIGGGIYFYVRRSAEALNRTWGDLGITTGLTLKPGGVFSQPELNGQYRQRPIRLYTYNAGSQGNRTTYTAITLTVRNPTNSSLEITPAGTVGNFFGKVLKAQDVEIGDPAFDARFVIKSNPPDFAGRVLGDARVRTKVMEIPGVFRLEIQGATLEYSKRGLEENMEYVIRLFNLLSDLADQLESQYQAASGL